MSYKKEELQEAAAILKKLLKCCECPPIICQKRETCKGCSFFLREYERSKALITGINTLEALAALPDVKQGEAVEVPAEVVIKIFDNFIKAKQEQ